MTKLQVETYGGVLLRKRSLADEESAQATLVNFAGTFSPRVESTCPGAVILDLAGTEKLLGPWQIAARNMIAQAVEIGFDLRIAMAANPDTAFLAARGFSANGVSRPVNLRIPADFCRRRRSSAAGFVACECAADFAGDAGNPEQLGDSHVSLAGRAAGGGTVERLGQEGLYLQKLARGEIERPLLTVEQNAEFVGSFEFDDPVETLESLFFILNRLLQELCLKLLSARWRRRNCG